MRRFCCINEYLCRKSPEEEIFSIWHERLLKNSSLNEKIIAPCDKASCMPCVYSNVDDLESAGKVGASMRCFAPTDNHAAYFISEGTDGIWIKDQWASNKQNLRSLRGLFEEKEDLARGGYVDPSNNADAYSVIE